MFVPLFLTGGSFGTAFGQVLHSGSVELYAAVGMAAFIAAGYKTPLAAVTFIAEATGGHAFIIPAVIGSAVAYAVSGDASVSGDQRLHEGVRVQHWREAEVSQIMQRDIVSVPASLNLREFEETILKQSSYTTFPVMDGHRVIGTISERSLINDGVARHPDMTVGDAVDREITEIPPNCDAMEALRLLLAEDAPPMLLVTGHNRKLEGIVTKSDLLEALKVRGEEPEPELERASGATSM